MEDVGIFFGHLVHFMVFCYILWTFGIVCGDLVYVSRFVILYQEKSGNPGLHNTKLKFLRTFQIVGLLLLLATHLICVS
jgi:hypothetical protein